MSPQKIIIDTDPGIDDVLAILLALSSLPEELEVLLISVTYGNIDLQNCLRNVISLFYYVEKEIAWRESIGRKPGFETLRNSKPVVAVGAEHPLTDNMVTVDLYGKFACGMNLTKSSLWLQTDEMDLHPRLTPAETWQRVLEVAEKSTAPEQGLIAEEMNKTASLFIRSETLAHLEILKLLRDNEPNSITIVAIGPMTNLALAAAEDPETFLKVKEIVAMGGSIDQAGKVGYQPPSHLKQVPNIDEPPFRLIKQAPGPIRDSLNIRNQTAPIAEFNIYADSVAAARVYALTSTTPHATMPPTTPSPLNEKEGVSPPPLLPSYPENLSKQLNITVFPLDITEKHVLTRGELEASLKPQQAAKSPLAEWVLAFMSSSFEKVGSLNLEISRDAASLQLHDPMTIWYCMDSENSNWDIIEGEDLRVETTGQWTKGMLVTSKRNRKKKLDDDASEAPGNTHGLTSGAGNRLNRCVGSPGQDIFSQLLLKRIFGS
ncbi:putative nucleoside hydrolase [Hypoxylon argillaceum]|nr:putative nucleoside hydrolase [Hypoxylon argillaceum]